MKKGSFIVKRNKHGGQKRNRFIKKTVSLKSPPSQVVPHPSHTVEEQLDSKFKWSKTWEWLHRLVIANELTHIAAALLSLFFGIWGGIGDFGDYWKIIYSVFYVMVKIHVNE